jgi:dihydroxyacid dehydratase/phosphogluconate dehydratase
MKLFFENSEWQRQNFVKWQIHNLFDVIIINSIFDVFQCLCKLMTELNIIQREIDSAYHELTRLRENVIRVCRDYVALIDDLMNSSMITINLINILQTRIINYETIQILFA